MKSVKSQLQPKKIPFFFRTPHWTLTPFSSSWSAIKLSSALDCYVLLLTLPLINALNTSWELEAVAKCNTFPTFWFRLIASAVKLYDGSRIFSFAFLWCYSPTRKMIKIPLKLTIVFHLRWSAFKDMFIMWRSVHKQLAHSFALVTFRIMEFHSSYLSSLLCRHDTSLIQLNSD